MSNSRVTLAIKGGPKHIKADYSRVLKWPIVTKEHEEAVLEVLHAGNMSGWNITAEFEKEFAQKFESEFAIGHPNGTMAILSGLHALGIGAGDEVICPGITYWASIVQLYSLGATPVFADIDPETLCIDPADIEKCITKRTKAIIVVHYAAMPADMDRISAIAEKYNLKLFEDCSHAHSSLYKGKQVGTFGDAAGFSIMSGKSFPVGEGGVLTTDDKETYEKVLLFGHYEKHRLIESKELQKFTGIPCGGVKGRMHQLSAAFGRVQLKKFEEQFAEINKAMNYFGDLIDELPGLKVHRPEKDSGCSKGGWYFCLAHYKPQELGGLSVKRFADAVSAEGVLCSPGCNKPLHTHPLFTQMDVYHHGKPTRFANLPEGSEKNPLYSRSLPVCEQVNNKVIRIPWFKHFEPKVIEAYAQAYKKVVENYQQLLDEDSTENEEGAYSSTFSK